MHYIWEDYLDYVTVLNETNSGIQEWIWEGIRTIVPGQAVDWAIEAGYMMRKDPYKLYYRIKKTQALRLAPALDRIKKTLINSSLNSALSLNYYLSQLVVLATTCILHYYYF